VAELLKRLREACEPIGVDRVYLAIIVSALLLLLGAAGVIVTRNADLMTPGRTVGISGSR
jgi:hypothetical protein